MSRDELEHKAMDVCPPDLWYELLDTIDETSDEDLHRVIEENS